METIETLNRRLLERYGTDIYLRPRYRIVWADDQFEKRESTFSDFHMIHTLIRTEKEVREVRKYPDFLGLHILETLTFCPFPDVKTHNGYEPLFVFQRNDGTRLQPIWSAVEFIIKRLNTKVELKSESNFVEQDEKEAEQEAQDFLAMLEDPAKIADAKVTGRLTIDTPSVVFNKLDAEEHRRELDDE